MDENQPSENIEFKPNTFTIKFDWNDYNESWQLCLSQSGNGKWLELVDIKVGDGVDKKRVERAVKMVMEEMKSMIAGEVNRKSLHSPLAEGVDKVGYEL